MCGEELEPIDEELLMMLIEKNPGAKGIISSVFISEDKPTPINLEDIFKVKRYIDECNLYT